MEENHTENTLKLISENKNITKLSSKTTTEQIKVLVLPTAFTLIPSALITENNSKKLLQFVANTSNALVYTDAIPTDKITLIWSITPAQKEKITKTFPGALFSSIFTPLIQSITRYKFSHKILSLFLGNQILFVISSNDKIELVNHFEINSVEDAIYYHLLMLQSINKDESDVLLITLGIKPLSPDFNKQIQLYFSNIEPLTSSYNKTLYTLLSER